MPSMKKEPCAKLTMRVTPKISDKPAATRNNEDAPAKPLSSCTTKLEKPMPKPSGRVTPGGSARQGTAAPAAPRSSPDLQPNSVGRTHFLDFVSAGLELGAIKVTVVHHHALAAFVLGAADEAAHGGLVVFRAVGDAAKRSGHLQALE